MLASVVAALVSLAGLKPQLNFGVVSPPSAASKQKVPADDEERLLGTEQFGVTPESTLPVLDDTSLGQVDEERPLGAAAATPASGFTEVQPEPEDQVDDVGDVKHTIAPGGAARYKPLYPYVIVDTRNEAALTTSKIRRSFGNPAVNTFDLIGNQAAARKMLEAMGLAGRGLQLAGQIESVRSPGQVKIRLIRHLFPPDLGKAETHQSMVSATTDPKALGVHMRTLLFDRFNAKPKQCVKLLGKGPNVAQIMYEAIDYLQRDVERLMSFQVAYKPNEGTEVTVYAAERLELNEGKKHASADDFQLRDLQPSAVHFSPLIEIREETDRIRCSVRTLRSLTMHTTPSVDLEVCVHDARGMVLFTLASLPDWLDAAAMIVPNPWRRNSRYRVVKGFVVDGLDENPPLQARVSKDTEPLMLARYIRDIMNGEVHEDVTQLDDGLSGQRATDRIEVIFDTFETANIVCSTLSHLFWETNREIYFTVSTERIDGQRGFTATVFWAT